MRSLEETLREDFREAFAAVGEAANMHCVIQGVEMPLDAPMFDLWRLMSHCDLFLYVTLRNPE